MIYDLIPSPLGTLTATSDGSALSGLYFEGHKGGPTILTSWGRDPAGFRELSRQLSAYFAKDLVAFDLDLSLEGTAFQRAVWDLLGAIPYGSTATYGELARRLGRPEASRAVGSAVGRNPISIVVPCHRVLGSSGAITGYAGGIDRKRRLLELEGAGSGPGSLFDSL